MLYNEVFSRLQNLINRVPTQGELIKILGIKQSTMSERARRNSKFTPYEIKLLNNHYGINLYTCSCEQHYIPERINTIQCCTDIPVYGDVSASMGYGISVYDEQQTGTYSISNKLAKDIGINLKTSEIIFASGDSMEPTIIGGDSLLVDKSKTEIYDGRIYCVRIEGQLYAKRLQKLPPKKIKVISDNQDKYDPFYIDFSQNIDFDFAVLGEIKWWGRVAK